MKTKAKEIAFNATIALGAVFALVLMFIIVPLSQGWEIVMWLVFIVANFLTFGWCIHDIVVAIDEA